ncbi:putative sugar nucleotidyl transferase [Salibacteraceae bacterium]|nr:putative sugar nucleotidyl transferase [Salibacteraceae bacterium]
MQNILLVDHTERDHLLPLTYTRPVADIRLVYLPLLRNGKNGSVQKSLT